VRRAAHIDVRVGGIQQNGDGLGGRHCLVQQAEALGFHFIGENGRAGEVAAWPIEIGDKTFLDWIAAGDDHNRNRRGCGLRCMHRLIAAAGDDLTDFATKSAAMAGNLSY
jgi:hypothetical protein